jgi:hypothetical protein
MANLLRIVQHLEIKSMRRLMTLFVIFAAAVSAQTSARPELISATKLPLWFPGNGAVCNGTTDDTSAINVALATLKSGGIAYIAANSFCLIDTANLTIPPNVRVQGVSGPNATNPGYTNGSGFILNPSYTINLNTGTTLENIVVKRSGLIPNPSSTEVLAAVVKWGSESSTGVTIPADVDGVNIDRIFVIGFNVCVKSLAGAFSISHMWGDCYNGLEVTSAGDNYYIDDVRFEPVYSLRVASSSGAWARPGIAFYLHDGDTGGVLTRVFSFMYANGVLMNNIGVTQIANSGWEWQSSIGNGVKGTVAVRWLNHNAQTSVANSYVNGFDTPFSDEGTGEVIVSTPSIPSATVSGFYLAGVTATPTAVTIAGTVAAGNTASVTVISPEVSGPPLKLTYTAVTGDTASTVATALANMVNRSQPLIAGHFFASSTGEVVTVLWPYATMATISAASTGGITDRARSGSVHAGSYGAIYGPNIGFNNVAAFTFGKGVNRWLIDAPYLTVYSGWLSAPDGSIATQLSLHGISYLHSRTSNLSSCGLHPSIDGNGTDEASTITEGTAATGCKYTFSVPFFKVPYCNVSSPTGSAITMYTATATSLTIVNPRQSEAQYTYRCDP